MKKFHLICNSHIDPVWMWDWEEGMGEAISTFWQAAEFCKEYDYVFCHNEALLYEYVEKYDPALFEEISRQVEAGKWHIMGGWYLQPDCQLPSGEAFVRQIKLGREYFEEKFGKRPTTAINFDSFGHSVGLVQILKKCGYDSYMFCRPMPNMLTLPDREFIWRGKDGSEVKASRIEDDTIYCSGFGTALADIKRKAEKCGVSDIKVALWGVGNHGGNPSRKDLADVASYMEEQAKEGVAVLHSTPEKYFADVHPTAVWDKSLPCLIGSYTSMSRIKRKHVELEHKLFTTEKLCSLAEMRGLYKKDPTPFAVAEKALAGMEFHDVGSGTCAADGEASTLRRADAAAEGLQVEFDKAFFAIASQDVKAAENTFPVFVFNQQPYVRDMIAEMEILIPTWIDNDDFQYTETVRVNGEIVPSQCIKELSNINYDRRKRLAVRFNAPAMDIVRLDVTFEKTAKEPAPTQPDGDIVYKDEMKQVRIGRKSGLIESYIVDGKELVSGPAFAPVLFDDNADPWGWDLDHIGDNPVPMQLSDCTKGVFRNFHNVRVIEDGNVLMHVESFFEGGGSYVRVDYKIYKHLPYTDITLDVFYNEREKALKIKIPTALKGEFFGQLPFGTETYEKDGKENPVQRFFGVGDGEMGMVVCNDGAFGFSHDGDSLYATLLRGVAYCAHPIGKRPLLKKDMFVPFIEQGKHTLRFRLSYEEKKGMENAAQEFVNVPFALCFFPHGKGRDAANVISLDNNAVSLVAFYQEKGAYVLRFINNNAGEETVEISLQGKKYSVKFGKYEVKTFIFDGANFKEKDTWY